MDVKDIILAASIAKGAGGSGGGVTKEYVDTQVGAVSERVDDVEGVIPSTATPQNQLATAADVSETAILSTSTTSHLTDSADGIVQGLTIYGRSEVVDGEIKSVGDDGLTVTTANSDNTLTTSANISTALPLRGVSDTVRDKLICTAESKQVETVCGKVRLADLAWAAPTITENRSVFDAIFLNFKQDQDGYIVPNLLTANFQAVPNMSTWKPGQISNRPYRNSIVLIVESTIATVTDLITALGNTELIYELSEPVTTPLTTAEISAFRGLRTFDSTTNITITDEPDFEFDYLKNTDNGKAVANIQSDLQGQIDGLKIKTLAYTGTGSSTNTITFPEKPTVIFQIQTVEDPNNAVGVCPFIYGETGMFVWYASKFTPGSVSTYHSLLSYNGLSMTITGSDPGAAQNVSGSEYKVYYI